MRTPEQRLAAAVTYAVIAEESFIRAEQAYLKGEITFAQLCRSSDNYERALERVDRREFETGLKAVWPTDSVA